MNYIKKFIEYICESSDVDLVKDCFLSIIDDFEIRVKRLTCRYGANGKLGGRWDENSTKFFNSIDVNIKMRFTPLLKDKDNQYGATTRTAIITDEDISNIESCIHLCRGYNDMQIIYIRVIHVLNNNRGTFDKYFSDEKIKGIPHLKYSLNISEFKTYIDSVGKESLREIIILFKTE